MPAGARPGERRGGRQKGTKNRKTVALIQVPPPETMEFAPSTQVLRPIDVMIFAMRWHFQEKRYDMAADAAAKVAPYLHPRLAVSTVNVRKTPAEMSDDELTAAAAEAEIAGRAAAGLRAAVPSGDSPTKH